MLTGAVALKEDDVQFVSNEAGDVPANDRDGLGLYYRDTRFLNRFELTINGVKPLFLSNSIARGYIATFQFINPSLLLNDGRRVKQQTISMRRSRFVSQHGLFERIGLLNCNHFDVELDVILAIDADFRDIFAIRGFATQRVAGEIKITFGDEDVAFAYQGRDGLRRMTSVKFSRPPEPISPREVRFCLRLAPQQFDSVVVQVEPRIGRAGSRGQPKFDVELEELARSYGGWDAACTSITTSSQLFDRELLRTAKYDIRSLIEHTDYGLVPDAGIPWYAVPFGRDAIITSLQTLVYNPSIAEGTLRFLAAHQGQEVNQYTEEEPGKILHEMRRGELARLHEVPHTPYFGTVDATPLFLVLLVESMSWLCSERLYDDLLPAARRALQWIDQYGDMDDDGYVEYITHRAGGVVNQGWKDSRDSVQYEDGVSATPPIALVEVQGYVYQAKLGMADLLRRHGDFEEAARLEADAQALRAAFNRDFWMADEQFYAQALDKDKRPIRSVTSNPGHCLWSGICDPEKAELVARRLLQSDMFSGWGIRTLSSRSPNYNPMSYHNGSIWPHDTAIIALGLRRAGFPEEAVEVIRGLVEAGYRFPDSRLPELFCGFERDKRFNSSPAAYLVSCRPQAWGSGAVFMLIQSMLGLTPMPDCRPGVDPVLPEPFSAICLDNLRVGENRFRLVVDANEGKADLTPARPSAR